MKKYAWAICLTLTVILTVMPTQKSDAFVWAVVKTAIKKVLKAIDIKVQKLQNKTIGLQNAQKVVENAMSKLKLKQINDFAEKERKLFSDYYDELANVKAAISTYQRVRGIVQQQLDLVEEYKATYNLLKNDGHFTPQEIGYMFGVYSAMIDQSLKSLDELYLVINPLQTKMSDGKRLELIAGVSGKMDKAQKNLLQFNRQNEQLSLNRSRSLEEINAVKLYYGLSP